MSSTGLESNKRALGNYLVLITVLLVSFICSADEEDISRDKEESSVSKIKLIYDGDIGPDPCDFSTLSMLHEYHNKGMIDLVGVVGETPDPYLASTFSIYNQFYGNDIPIGSFNSVPGGVTFSDDVKKV